MKKLIQCCERVSPPDRWGAFHTHQCKKWATTEENGKPYCTVHAPSKVKARRDAAYEKYTGKMNKEVRGIMAGAMWDQAMEALKACMAVCAGDPYTGPDEALKMAKAVLKYDKENMK